MCNIEPGYDRTIAESQIRYIGECEKTKNGLTFHDSAFLEYQICDVKNKLFPYDYRDRIRCSYKSSDGKTHYVKKIVIVNDNVYLCNN
jgi:hypothetical protein